MAAPHEAALPQIGRELRERLRQVLLQLQIHLLRVEGGKARRVDDPCLAAQREHLHMAGGVAAAAQRLADLPHRQRQLRREGVEDAGLADAGITCKGVQLAIYCGAQCVQSLPCCGADAQHLYGGAGVDAVQLVRRVKVALVQTQQYLAALQRCDGGDAVDEVRLRHRDGGAGNDDQLVDVGGGGAEEYVLPRLHGLYKALAAAQLPYLHPVAHQRAESLAPEPAPGAALQHLIAGVHIVEAAEGLLNAPPAQKLISCVGEDATELSLMQVK